MSSLLMCKPPLRSEFSGPLSFLLEILSTVLHMLHSHIVTLWRHRKKGGKESKRNNDGFQNVQLLCLTENMYGELSLA